MAAFFCYTTVFQAVEVFALLRSPREREAAERAMAAMKILGLNPKNAMQYGDLFANHRRLRSMHLLAAGLCLDSRLPLLTDRRKDFAGIRRLVIVPTRALRRGKSGMDILHELQR
jgi:predicted nucleic acid-binding protein